MFCCIALLTVAQPDPICPPDDPHCPIDSGIIVLIASGIGFAAKRYYQKEQNI